MEQSGDLPGFGVGVGCDLGRKGSFGNTAYHLGFRSRPR